MLTPSVLVRLVNSHDTVNDVKHTLGKWSRYSHEIENCDNWQPSFLEEQLQYHGTAVSSLGLEVLVSQENCRKGNADPVKFCIRSLYLTVIFYKRVYTTLK